MGPREPVEIESYTCTPGCTRTHYTAQADLEFAIIILPQPPRIDIGGVTVPGFHGYFSGLMMRPRYEPVPLGDKEMEANRD